MLDFRSILVFSENPKGLSDFYKKILDKDPEWTEGDWYGFGIGNGGMAIGPHDKVKGKNMNPERIIFNFDSDDVKHEFQRIKELGAQVIQEPYQPSESPDMWICTFADPDGNFFQIATPWKA